MLSVHMLVNSGKHSLVISVAIYTCLTTFDHVLTRLMLVPSNFVLVIRNTLRLLRKGKGRSQNSLSVTTNKPQRMTNIGDGAYVIQICQWAPADAM